MKRGVFIGWWAKEEYAFVPGRSLAEAKLFTRYSKAPLSEEEKEAGDAAHGTPDWLQLDNDA